MIATVSVDHKDLSCLPGFDASLLQIDCVHGHLAASPTHVHHSVSDAWLRNHLDYISSRNPNGNTLPVHIAHRQRRFVQFESSGMHGHPPMQTVAPARPES